MRPILLAGLWFVVTWSGPAEAFRIHDAAPVLGGGSPVYLRWDAAPRDVVEEERSLDGGLRYAFRRGR